jgi:hypothetical protein
MKPLKSWGLYAYAIINKSHFGRERERERERERLYYIKKESK